MISHFHLFTDNKILKYTHSPKSIYSLLIDKPFQIVSTSTCVTLYHFSPVMPVYIMGTNGSRWHKGY